MTRPELAVVVVAHNSEATLPRCLNSLQSCRYSGRWKTSVIVDNGSRDDTRGVLETSTLPGLNVVTLPDNIGYGRAVNMAVRHLLSQPDYSPEYLLLLDPDCFIFPGTICALVDVLSGDSKLGAVSPRVFGLGGAEQRVGHRIRTRRSEVGRIIADVPPRRCPPRSVDWLLGCCLLVRTTALLKVGMLEESFFVFAEDIDLGWKLRRAGWSLDVVNCVSVLHVGGASAIPRASGVELEVHKLCNELKFYEGLYTRRACRQLSALRWAREMAHGRGTSARALVLSRYARGAGLDEIRLPIDWMRSLDV